MGQMNLLKASVVGKLGETYGTEVKGQAILHAIPFSHAPHSETQTKSVRAFEKVNRIAGGLAKVFWPYLHLSDSKMLRHNAVASWLKPLIVNHQFDISKITTIAPDRNNTSIQAATVNFTTSTYAVEVAFSDLPTPIQNAQGAVLLADENGKVIFSAQFSGASYANSGIARLDETLTYYCLLFRSDYNGIKWQPNSFRLLQATIQN